MVADHEAPGEFAGRLSKGRDWKEVVTWVGDLPPLPHIAARAISLIEDPDVSAGQLADLLGKDTALAARVLKIANSAMFSRQREITTINQAIMLIGFKALKGIIVAATLRQMKRSSGDIDKMIWANSACTAVGSYTLAHRLRKEFADEAFLLGLLHDLGKLVLVQQLGSEYRQVVDKTKEGLAFHQAEQDILGFAHPLIGALVAKKWNFSPSACQIILHHHDPLNNVDDNKVREQVAIVQAADLIAHHLGFGHKEGYPSQTDAAIVALTSLGFDSEETQTAIIAEISAAFADQTTVLG